MKKISSDVEYRELYKAVRNKGFIHAGNVICLQEHEKQALARELMSITSASRLQICKYLHMDNVEHAT